MDPKVGCKEEEMVGVLGGTGSSLIGDMEDLTAFFELAELHGWRGANPGEPDSFGVVCVIPEDQVGLLREAAKKVYATLPGGRSRGLPTQS